MELIGKKVKGFKFEDTDDLGYLSYMDNHIGEVGKIVHYDEYDNSYKVQFDNKHWFYPADQIEAHLVDEWVVGEEYEFCDGDEKWMKGKLLGIIDHDYKYVTNSVAFGCPCGYKQIRHIEKPNKEILDQIAVLEKELSNLKSKIK